MPEPARRRVVVLRRTVAVVAVMAVTSALPLTASAAPAATPSPSPTAGKVSTQRVPSPSAATSVITVKVGGDRKSQNGVDPLAGVVLELHDGVNAPDAAAINEPWAVCTSDDDGDCSFVVPDTAANAENRDRQFWVVQKSAPTGWRSNPELRTGFEDGTGAEPNTYAFRTGRLLRAGEVYESGAAFMRGTGNDLRTASGGIWQSSRLNPTLPVACGQRIGLVLDVSGSVGSSGQLPELKRAATSLVDSLVGTRSQIALFPFNSTAPATGANGENANLPATALSTAEGAETVKRRIAGLTASGSSNWDRGLFEVAASSSAFDVAVLLTDNYPTLYGSASGPGNFTRFREVENAIFSANAIKAKGARVLALGVGKGVDGSTQDLAAVSGPEQGSDFYTLDSYADAGAVLEQVLAGACEGSVTVVSQVVPNTAPEGSTEGAQVDGQWEYSATAGGSVTVAPPSASTGLRTGAASFGLTFPRGVTSHSVSLNQTLKLGYTLQQVGGLNASCTDLRTGSSVPTNNLGDSGFIVEATPTSALTCWVFNRAPSPPATLVVNKVWKIDEATFKHGAQPPDFRATPAIAGRTNLAFGVDLPGYLAEQPVEIGEVHDLSARPGCRVTSSRLTEADGTTDSDTLPYSPVMKPGRNVFTITTEVTCRTELRLLNEVEGGPADPAAWTLGAQGPAGSTAFSGGPSGVTGAISPTLAYALTTAGGDPVYRQHVDPESTVDAKAAGSWRCVELDPDGNAVPGFAFGRDGTVTARRGSIVKCTATQETAELVLANTVANDHGGTAVPGEWQLSATPTEDVPGLTGATVPGSTAGAPVLVRPGVAYALSASGPSSGYEQRSLECAVNGDPTQPATSITLNPLDQTVCTFAHVDTAAPSAPTWSFTRTSDPEAGSTVEPGDRITYTLKATNTSDLPVDRAVITNDVSTVLARAILSDLPRGLTHDGSTLTWQVPTLAQRGATAEVSYTVDIYADAPDGVLQDIATGKASGGVCEVGTAAPADTCATRFTIARQDTTDSGTPTGSPGSPGSGPSGGSTGSGGSGGTTGSGGSTGSTGSTAGSLASTGGPTLLAGLVGLVLLVGAGFAVSRGRRPRR